MRHFKLMLPLITAMLLVPSLCFAEGHFQLPKDISILWVLPFVCMLLSIALGPLFAPHFWEHHFGKVALFWALAFLVPCGLIYGYENAAFLALDSLLLEYIPFILLLLSLFTVAGGIRLKGTLVGNPIVNTGILALGAFLASWMGTTGSAMLLIRPLLNANKHRRFRVHQVIFFIFLVANIGGSLSPLGDPPLFLGFLKGVSFFWTTVHLFPVTLLAVAILLGVYLVLDTVLFLIEKCPKPENANTGEKLGFEGNINFIFLGCIVLNTLISGAWSGPVFHIYGVPMELQNVIRDIMYIVIAIASWVKTDR